MICIAIVEYPYIGSRTRVAVTVPANAFPGDVVRFEDFGDVRIGEIISTTKVDESDCVLEMFDAIAHGGKMSAATDVFRKVAEEA